MTGQPERTALYRIYDDAEALLYIGITSSIPVRWNGHQSVQPWWDEVRSLTMEWYDTRAGAEAAEKAAILAEQPKYNVTYLKPVNRRDCERLEVQPVNWESMLTMAEVADRLRVSEKTVARMIRDGVFTKLKMGGLVRIDPSEVVAYKKHLHEQAKAS